MFNPPHPGRILMDTVRREDGRISVTEFAGCANNGAPGRDRKVGNSRTN
jgi:hypothetical protein